MRPHPARIAPALVVAAGVLSCADSPTALQHARPVPGSARFDATSSLPTVLVSQIYGGGGNSGATLTNDFIELFNPGTSAVSVDGWSVQYASAAGTSWQVTNLAGSIPAGGYYLVQESKGSGGTQALPAPDATGTIAMSATAGKVAVVASVSPLAAACPAAGTFVDQVSFGTSATDCGAKTTATLSNTTAAVRQGGGCAFTGDVSVDFAKDAPAPRNTATAPRGACAGIVPAGPLDHLAIAGPSTVDVGGTIQLSATPQDANNKTVTTASVTWSSDDPAVATVDATGKVTGVAASASPVTIRASAINNDIVKTASVPVSVVSPAIRWIDVSSSSTSFPAGFQTQLFATARTAQNGAVIQANFKFEAVDPDVATITTVQNSGIITGVAAPADPSVRPGFRIIATPLDNATPPDTFVTHSITIEAPNPAPTSIYAKNDEFGDPTAASAQTPNDLLIVRPEYTISYNESRGTPNWVSYELDARQMQPGQDRCNCFTADPLLPADKQIFTSDYTSGGFDRGHMTRSADRTAGNIDNAATFYLTNVVPQQADLNQGVWAQFENALADSANQAGRAVYIVTGPLFSRSHGLTFLKNEGKVAVPDSTWKIALIGPRDGGVPFTRANLQSWSDLAGVTVLAVNMPNTAGVRSDPWQKYLTTIDKIESATGYDFLSLLPVAFQTAIEAGDHAPTASFVATRSLNEGAAIAFDASPSTDPDLGRTDLDRAEALTYTWHFSDGANASGKTVTHTFATSGTYTAVLTVTDAYGWQDVTSQTELVANVPPAIATLAGDTILTGEAYKTSGSFADPGVDTWNAAVNYGDGSATQTLSLNGKTFELNHSYTAGGAYTVTVTVGDGNTTSTAAATVLVETPLQGVGHLDDAVTSLEAPAGPLNKGEAAALHAALRVVAGQLGKGHDIVVAATLRAFVAELRAMVISHRLSSGAAAPLIDYAQRLITSVGAS